MSRIFRVVIVIALLAPAAWAQTTAPSTQPSPDERSGRGPGGGPGGQRMMQRMREMLDELKLSDEQRTQIDQALNEARDEMRALREELEQSDLMPRERFQRMREEMQEFREEISNLLTQEQRARFREQLEDLRGPGGEGFRGRFLERWDEIQRELELTEEQKAKADQIIAEAQAKMQELRQGAQQAGQRVRGQFRSLMQETRQKLEAVLTEPQREKLRELLPPGPPPPARPQDQPPPATQPEAGAHVGDRAPDFALRKLDGLPVQLSSFKGRVLVLGFGSYSSPSFRDRAAGMEELKRKFGARASFLIIYTREAHAKDEWEVQRNQDEQIDIRQPADEEGRKALAKAARDALDISIPIAVDDMSDSTAAAYEGMPNVALIIGRDGIIAYRQQWCDPDGLQRKLEEALKQPA